MQAAPLLSIPEAPAPVGGVAEWYRGADGARLRAALFTPQGSPRGSVILSPGRTEPIEKYLEVVGELMARGFVVLVHDWRGQGLSARALKDALAGHASGWRPFLADFDALLSSFASRLPQPWIAMGHSMGGGLTALALAQGETRFAAAVLSAPMVGLNLGRRSMATVGRLASVMGFLGRTGAYVAAPLDPLNETFEGNLLTHDRGRWARYRAQITADPDLRLGGPTWGWLAFALELCKTVRRTDRIARLDIPLLVVAAGEEKLCDNAAAKALADRAPQGLFVQVPGALHEILMETDERRAVFWRAFDALADQVAPASV